MSTTLVTGSTGFIGKYVVRYLAEKNIEVILTSRASDNDNKQPTVYLNIDDPTSYRNLSKYKYDRVIHLAWGGLPNYLSSEHLVKELPSQIRFLTWLIEQDISDITISGTCFEYGMQEGELNELNKCEPITYYGIAKNALRQYLQALQYYCPHQFRLKWLRLFYIYGQGQGEKSLYTQLNSAIANKEKVFNMSPGDQERDFLPVEKAARYIVDLALTDEIQGIINVCSGRPKSVVDFVKEYLSESNAQIELNLGFYDYPKYEAKSFWGARKKS